MNFIESEANDFYTGYFLGGVSDLDRTYDKLKIEVNRLDGDDRIHYLEFLKAKLEDDFEEHLKVCKAPDTCPQNKDYKRFIYYLDKDIKGIQRSSNIHTTSNTDYHIMSELDKKIDSILAKLDELGLGHEILYDEIQDLKKHTNLDKKTFKQLVLGKLGEIVFSEAGSQIAEILKDSGISIKDIYKSLTGSSSKLLGS